MNMKKNNYSKVALAFVAMVALCFSCITIKEITIPAEVNAGETIEFDVNWEFKAETERSGNFVLVMLFPKSWGAANTIEASFSTSNLPTQGQFSSDITNEKMVICNGELEPTYGVAYSSAAQAHYGSCGNYGSVEWCALRSQTKFETNGSDAIKVDGEMPIVSITVHVKVKVGDPNIAYNFAAGICGTQSGFGGGDNAEYCDAFIQGVTVKNGTGDFDNFTVPKLASTVPGEIGYGDIFSVVFSANIAGAESALKGANDVYVMVEADMADGSMKSTTAKNSLNLMTSADEGNTFTKYIYLPQLLGVNNSKDIKKVRVWFENKAGDVVENSGGDKFKIASVTAK